MKTPRPIPAALRVRGQAAFTMIEIALALAVIGFALVAIVGVLPMGMEVQKQNREDTIIDHDASFFLDGIRNGARGLDDLTNYVFEIRQNSYEYDASGNRTLLSSQAYNYNPATTPLSPFDGKSVDTTFPINTGARIIGLLGLPKYQPAAKVGGFISNNVVAYVRALSGAATEKVPQRDAGVRELSFNYRMTSEITPIPAPPFTSVIQSVTNAFANNLRANLHEVRLLFRWPLKPNGEPGPTGREVYRTLVGGETQTTNDNQRTLYYFHPSFYKPFNNNQP